MRHASQSGRLVLPMFVALLAARACAAAAPIKIDRAGGRVTVTRGDVTLVFDKGGGGLVTSAALAGQTVSRASKASGLFASVIVPAGPVRPLEPIRGRQVDGAVEVEAVKADQADGEARVRISGKVAFAGLGEAPFVVTAVTSPDGGEAADDRPGPPAMAVSAELQPPAAARKAYLASFGLAVPLALTFHPTSHAKPRIDPKTVAVAILPRAGTPIPEVRRLVGRQDDTGVWGQMLWTLAGIRQITPAAFEVWEAWSGQNPMFVLQHHNVHPGWMAVADGRVALAAALPGIEQVAPKEIYVDSQAKLLRICFQSPYCRPLRLGDAPKVLSAGPAYVYIEPSGPGTRKAADYGDPQKRPALADLPKSPGKLNRTGCNFGRMQIVRPVPKKAPAVLPADPAFASHDPSADDEIDIWVDGPHGADLDAFPLTRGVPLKRGVLTDAKRASLLDAAGRPVPCAARAVAYWPDRSVKWLLLDWQGHLKARADAKYKLLVGQKARPVAVPRPLKVTESPGRVVIDTGALRAELAQTGSGLALTFGFDAGGEGEAARLETVVRSEMGVFGCTFSHVADSTGYASRTWRDPGEPDEGVVRITELRVEEQSPLRAVVLVRANLEHRLVASTIPQKHRPPVGTPVALRLHFHAGSSAVRVQHTFMFAGDVNHDFLRQLGVRLPLPVEAGRKIRTSVDGVAVSLKSAAAGGLLQEAADAALAWEASGGGVKIVARGREADGWLDVTGPRWGVTVGLRHMREMFPQEIHLGAGGLWTHFYSPRAAPMDLRRYAFKYGSGESASTGWGTAFGAMRTHEAAWYFHRADEKPAAGPTVVRAMLDPPLARVRPRHVADTLAVGHVAEHGAASNDKHLDDVLLHMPRMHQHNGRFWRWTGFWDFGDEIQVYNAARSRWAKDDGRYGWYNNEPVRDYNYHLAYLMTGNRRIWRQARAMSYHVFEVDLRHASPQPFMGANAELADQRYSHSTTRGIDFCGRRHNAQHWADGYFGRRVGSPPGFRLCYYQNGDPVMREYLERICAAAMKTRRSQYMSADGDEAVLWAMLAGYEMTLEPKYLDRIRAYAALQVDFARKHGGIPAARANWDWASNTAGAPPAEPRGDLWIWSFGGHIALIEAADVLGDRKLDRMLRDWTLALEGLGPDKKRRDAWSNNIGACSLLAYYYRRTGDKRALEWLVQRMKRFHSYIPRTAPRDDLPTATMDTVLPAYTPNDGYGWVYTTSSFWYVGIPAWQGALRARAVNRQR